MPTDAKCGLLVGVGLVLAVAVLFFQKDPAPGDVPVPVPTPSPAAAVRPPDVTPLRDPGSALGPGQPVSRVDDDDPLQSRLP